MVPLQKKRTVEWYLLKSFWDLANSGGNNIDGEERDASSSIGCRNMQQQTRKQRIKKEKYCILWEMTQL